MRFFLDNCLALRHARALHQMVQPDHEFIHLQDKFPADTKDEEWIRKLVISGDYRIGKSAHERRAWHESGLTVFFLMKGWMNISPLLQHSKLAAILDKIVEEAARADPGSGFSITVNGKIEQVYQP